MGSALGGLYTPILSTFTLFLIGIQLYRQHITDQRAEISWFIDRSIDSGEKALLHLKAAMNDINNDKCNVWEHFLRVVEQNNPELTWHFLCQPVNQRLYSSALHYFSNLEGLKKSNDRHVLIAYQELKSTGSMTIGYREMLLMETEVMRGKLKYAPHFAPNTPNLKS